jgi:hypothetical protein
VDAVGPMEGGGTPAAQSSQSEPAELSGATSATADAVSTKNPVAQSQVPSATAATAAAPSPDGTQEEVLSDLKILRKKLERMKERELLHGAQ